MCLEEVNRTELIIKGIEREIKRMLKDIPCAEYRLSMPGIGSILAVVLTPLLHKDEIDSTEYSHKRRFPIFLGYFLKATLGLI